VLDEIAAIPACFMGWIAMVWWKSGATPAPAYFIGPRIWSLTVGVFVAFRLFDIVKPWPVRQSQSLHGGLGVVVDDLLAAVYVNVMVLSVYAGQLALNG
jgi:phosphatidylglycerophosphatase A